MKAVHPEQNQPTGPVACKLCRAALEVRVRFRGTLVWTVDPESPEFGAREPELRGEHRDPRLVCSADVMHETGFALEDGEIVPSAKAPA
jgi:hypothetical protein